MKYMLMMHAPKGKGDGEIFNWPSAALTRRAFTPPSWPASPTGRYDLCFG